MGCNWVLIIYVGTDFMKHVNFSLLLILTTVILSSCGGGSSKSSTDNNSPSFEVAFPLVDLEVHFNSNLEVPIELTIDQDHEVTISINNTPQLGQLTVNNNVVTYAPSGSFGVDSFTIKISDGIKEVEQPFNIKVTDLSPFLAFTDLISGPSEGLQDGLGSGVIATVWGYRLGEQSESTRIELCDLEGLCTPMAHVYYWKDADGQLPGGPANLFESHGMQEIAFSIPKSAHGEKSIRLTNEFGYSELPFTVRSGNIYHIMRNGDDATGDGSYSNPWNTVEHADANTLSGSTLYLHNLEIGSEETDKAIYNNNLKAMSSLAEQYSYVAYPNTAPEVIGHRGFSAYSGGQSLTTGFVVSKLSFYNANADEDQNGLPVDKRASGTFAISGTKDGRAIGNYITDHHPSDLNGACPDSHSGAINGSAPSDDMISNFKVLGNQIEDYGCKGTSKLHHTTYFSIRSGEQNKQLAAPEIGWNYLLNNQALYGLHYYDENLSGEECGQFITPLIFHNNVVINQSGSGLSAGASCPITTDIVFENNIVINSGLNAAFDGSQYVGNSDSAVNLSIKHEKITSNFIFNNNLLYEWNAEDKNNFKSCIALKAGYDNASIFWQNNICYTQQTDVPMIKSSYLGTKMESKFSGSNNLWFFSVKDQASFTPNFSQNDLFLEPKIIVNSNRITIGNESPLIKSGYPNLLDRDIYGYKRSSTPTIGPVEPF